MLKIIQRLFCRHDHVVHDLQTLFDRKTEVSRQNIIGGVRAAER